MDQIYKKFLFFILIYSALPNSVIAKTVTVQSEYRFGPNISENQACKMALEKAKFNAISTVIGEVIYSDNSLTCSEKNNGFDCQYNKSYFEQLNGKIKKIKSKKQTVEKVNGFSICKIDLVADVLDKKIKKDPNLNFKLKLNKKVFSNKEPIQIKITPSKAQYIYIFQWTPYIDKNKINKVYPNYFDNNNFVEKETSIPNNKYQLVATYPKNINLKYADEYLIVISSFEPLNLFDEYQFDEFQNLLAEIPSSKYRIKKINYEIIK